MIAARGTRRCRPGSPWRRWGAASGRSANDRGHNAWAAERRVREWRTGMTISDRAEAGEGSAGRASGAGCLCVGVVILAKTVTTEMGGGLPGEELMVCMTLPSREADSNFQFPATVSFVKRRYSSFFCREGADVARSVPPKSGTTSSNPVPSSGKSVSPGNFLLDFYKPAFSAGWSCTLVIGANAGSRSEWPSARRYSDRQVLSLYVAGVA